MKLSTRHVNQQEYRVVAALDTETRNCADLRVSLPVCWQIGYNGGVRPEDTDPDKIEISIVRTYPDLYKHLAKIARDGARGKYAPVIMVQNLAYDLHFLMGYLDTLAGAGYEIGCCFKSSIKPLNIKIMRGNVCMLCFWDTLSFSGMSLAKMGRQCGYQKAVGDWDYSLSRTPETELTREEEHYATEDIRVMFAWLRFYLSLNPEIEPAELGTHILTKTSVVRYKCRQAAKGATFKDEKGRKRRVYQSFLELCESQLPKDETEYNLMIKSTSAGWTFTAARAAGSTFEHVKKYDARSMHPSHMLSHYYPINFEHVTDPEKAMYIFDKCICTSRERLLANWYRPFEFAFAARVRFVNLRYRRDTVYERDEIALHGQGLFKDYECQDLQFADDESSVAEVNRINNLGWGNIVENPTYEFGKLIAADSVTLTLNELNAWVHSRVYEWDAYEILGMVATANYTKPPDFVVRSVAMMLERKSVVKDILRTGEGEMHDWIPESAYRALIDAPDSAEAKAYYMSVKSDLNSLYGMFATNEAKRTISYIAGSNTFGYTSNAGMENLPKVPKAWYQFGLRIAAWSRVQQACAMEILAPVCDTFINGDTDSFAFETHATFDEIEEILKPLHSVISHAMEYVTDRANIDTNLIEGLGLYEVDARPDKYCAVANKRYAYTTDSNTVIHVASAGVPTASVKAALDLELQAHDFSTSVIRALGYNCTYVGKLSGFRAQVKPEWNETLQVDYPCTDYKNNEYIYKAGQPVGTYIYETDKILGYAYDSDHARACSNAGTDLQPMHFYEMTVDGQVKEY